MPPAGGVRASITNLVASLTAPFGRAQRRGVRPRVGTAPTTGPRSTPPGGAPSYSYSWGGGPGQGSNIDITQFAPVFQPSGGLFAPGYPLVPVEPERLRRYNFPVGVNYIYTPRSYERYGFPELRALADNHNITRLCIETRKDQIEALEWTIGPTDNHNWNSDVEDRVAKVTEFWRKPDGYHHFGTWLRILLEDLLVIDAPTLEVMRNRGGDIIALDYIDGATIKVLIDDTGRRPLPPAPAYEQIIHGRPWVLTEDGLANSDQEGKPVFPDQIIYRPRNPRANHLYGMSPVEQIVLTANIAFRRQIQQLNYFTDGNVPKGIINAPPDWTPEQIVQYQDWFDSLLEGNIGKRQKIYWAPFQAKWQPMLDPPHKDIFDEWLSRIVCFAFSLPPNAFVERTNRATAQTAQQAALAEGLGPLMKWTKALADEVIQDRMGHKDLEFQWALPPELDPAAQSKILETYVDSGVYTLNEARDALGLDPVEGGDITTFRTANGPIPLSVILQQGVMGGPFQGMGPASQKPGSASSKPNQSLRPAPKRPPGGGKLGIPKRQQLPPASQKPARAPRPGGSNLGSAPRGQQIASVSGFGSGLNGDLGKAADPLLDKQSAGYVGQPIADEQCSKCVMFQPPMGCELVKGATSPRGHCRYFTIQPQQAPVSFDPRLFAGEFLRGHVDPANAIPTSFPFADPIDQADVLHTAWQLVREGDLSTSNEDIPIDKIYGTQEVVDADRVTKDQERWRDGSWGEHLPLALEREGNYYILSGHHHTEAAIREGAKEIPAQIMHAAAH